MEQNKMKVAIVGYGGMGGWHADRLLKSDACELTGIYDMERLMTRIIYYGGSIKRIRRERYKLH